MTNTQSAEKHPWAGLSLTEIFARIEQEKQKSLKELLDTPNGLKEYAAYLREMSYPQIRAFLEGGSDQE